MPDFETVKRIAKVLKVSPTYFYAESEQMALLILKASNLSKSRIFNESASA